MAIRTQIRLAQLTGSLNDGGSLVGTQIPYDVDSLQGSLDQAVTAIKKIHGSTSFANATAGTFYQHVIPSAPGSWDLGSADFEWGALYIGDDKKISLGLGQDWTVEWDNATSRTLIEGGEMKIAGNSGAQKLEFRDAANYINSPAASDMAVVAGADIELQAGTVVIVDSPLLHLEDDAAQLKVGSSDPWSATHAANELLVDATDHISFRATGNSIGSDAANQLDLKASTKVLATTALLQVSGDATILGNDLDFAAGNANVGASVGAANLTLGGATTLTIAAGDLQVNGNDIKSSTGATAITLQQGNVIIPGDLTVQGATTSIDTTNLEVEDKFIGLNFTSGSVQGGQGDVGIIMGQVAGGDNPTMMAMYFDQSESRFKFVNTTSAVTGSVIADGAFVDLEIADLWVGGGDIKNDTATALAISAGATPDVTVSNDLLLLDDNFIKFGTNTDVTIRYNETGGGTSADKFEVLQTVGEGMNFSVPAAKNMAFAVNSVPRLIVLDSGLQLDGATDAKIEAATGKDILLQGVASQDIRVDSEQLIKLVDGNKHASWTDAEGIPLSTNADSWSDFRTSFGQVSLMDAIVAAGGGVGTLQKRTVEVTGSGFPVAEQVPLALDLSNLSVVKAQEQVDVFVNGQLLASSSEVSGNGDYSLAAFGAATKATFTFALVQDDVVTATVR